MSDYEVVEFANGTYGVRSKEGFLDKDFLSSRWDTLLFFASKYSPSGPLWWNTPRLIVSYSQTSKRRAHKLCRALVEYEQARLDYKQRANNATAVVAVHPCDANS